jgi:hypothetical protein
MNNKKEEDKEEEDNFSSSEEEDEEDESEDEDEEKEDEEDESEEEQQQRPITPTLAPVSTHVEKKKKKTNKEEEKKQLQKTAHVHYPPVKKKKSIKTEEIPPPIPNKKKRKKPELVTVPTNNPNVVVQMKKKKKGPKTQKVIIYEEDLPQQKIHLVKKTHKRGRPKTNTDVIIDKDEGINITDDKIVIDRPAQKTKELSARQLKRMELDAKFVEMEAIAGRKLRQTKNGKIDGRCVKERSPAQIAAAQKLAIYNKEMRKQKAQEKNKNAVKDVISELAVAQHVKNKEAKQVEEEKKQNNFDNFRIFAD